MSLSAPIRRAENYRSLSQKSPIKETIFCLFHNTHQTSPTKKTDFVKSLSVVCQKSFCCLSKVFLLFVKSLSVVCQKSYCCLSNVFLLFVKSRKTFDKQQKDFWQSLSFCCLSNVFLLCWQSCLSKVCLTFGRLCQTSFCCLSKVFLLFFYTQTLCLHIVTHIRWALQQKDFWQCLDVVSKDEPFLYILQSLDEPFNRKTSDNVWTLCQKTSPFSTFYKV